MSRDLLVRGLLVAAVLALCGWMASCTEWVEREVPTPPKGEALTNPLYAAQQLARELGARVENPTGLSALPPSGATLWLTSSQWDLFPGTAKRLREWVDGGGHLVIPSSLLGNENLAEWIAVRELDPKDADTHDDAQPASAPARGRIEPPVCQALTEPGQLPPAYGERRPFKLCNVTRIGVSGDRTLWALGDFDNAQIVRVAFGQGSVTVVAPDGLFGNGQLFKGDHAAVLVATLQLRTGAAVWFVTEESRTGFLRWLWQRAWVAVVLGAIAIALALWRGATRFGPLAAPEVPVRRSMAEQIRGTAQFLRLQGGDSLHAAQMSALENAARLHLPNYQQLGRSDRAALLAKVTGLDAPALAGALDRTAQRKKHRPAHTLPATLELLETARRRLLLAARDRSLPARLAPTLNPVSD
jgi:hypothetical protein